MWLSMRSAPVFGLHAFPRFMSIDKNGGTDSHAPCAVAVSQALRSLRQALACKRVLVHVSARIHDPGIHYTRSRSPQAAHVDGSSRVLSPHRAPCAWCTSRCIHVCQCVSARCAAVSRWPMGPSPSARLCAMPAAAAGAGVNRSVARQTGLACPHGPWGSA